jgi:hypothetical protein
MLGDYQNIMTFYEGPIKVVHCKKIKLSFEMHPQLINMDLQEGIVIKCI